MGHSISLKLERSAPWTSAELAWLKEHCARWQQRLSPLCEPYAFRKSKGALRAVFKPGPGPRAADDSVVLLEAGRELEVKFPGAAVEWSDGFDRVGVPSAFGLEHLREALLEEHEDSLDPALLELEREGLIGPSEGPDAWKKGIPKDLLFTDCKHMFGIVEGTKVQIEDSPRGFLEALYPLPLGVTLNEALPPRCDVFIAFADKRSAILVKLQTMKRRASDTGAMWLCVRGVPDTQEEPISLDFVLFAALEMGVHTTATDTVRLTRAWTAFRVRGSGAPPRSFVV